MTLRRVGIVLGYLLITYLVLMAGQWIRADIAAKEARSAMEYAHYELAAYESTHGLYMAQLGELSAMMRSDNPAARFFATDHIYPLYTDCNAVLLRAANQQ